MNRWLSFIWLTAVFIILSFLTDCGTSPTGSDDQSTPGGMLTVHIVDTEGEPVVGAQVTTFPKTVTRITDQDGYAVFENMSFRQYQILVSRSDLHLFYQNVNITNAKTTLLFTIAIEVTINLTIVNPEGKPIEGVEISTSPVTSIVLTDNNGKATINNIPVKSYTFIINKAGTIAYMQKQSISIRNGKVQDIQLIVPSQSPIITIIEPLSNSYHGFTQLKLVAEGRDFEDGILPSDAFMWISDIEGVLGTGAELVVDRLSIGHHTITVVATDKDLNQTSRTRNISIFFYSKDSFYPIPNDAYWRYSTSPTQFTGTLEDGTLAAYSLTGISVEMEDVNVRTSTMTYEAKAATGTQCVAYTVSDYYDTDDDAFFVTNTMETIRVWFNRPTSDKPTSILTMETIYDTKYPLFKNHFDLSQDNDFSYISTAAVTWVFDGITYSSKPYTETVDIESQSFFEGMETIDTYAGPLETARIRIVQGETERTWWLAKGYGIVQFTFNTFDVPITSKLTESNITTFFNDIKTKPAESPQESAHAFRTNPDITTSEGVPPQTRNFFNQFRTMAPR
jgi:hypothetical protein